MFESGKGYLKKKDEKRIYLNLKEFDSLAYDNIAPFDFQVTT